MACVVRVSYVVKCVPSTAPAAAAIGLQQLSSLLASEQCVCALRARIDMQHDHHQLLSVYD